MFTASAPFRFPESVLLGVQNGTRVRWIHRMRGAGFFVCMGECPGAVFPACARRFLPGGALPIPDDFDFEGEALLMKDEFLGLQNSQVYSILPGRVVSVGKDAAGYVVELITAETPDAIFRPCGYCAGESFPSLPLLFRWAVWLRRIAHPLYFEVIRKWQVSCGMTFYAETHVVK